MAGPAGGAKSKRALKRAAKKARARAIKEQERKIQEELDALEKKAKEEAEKKAEESEEGVAQVEYVRADDLETAVAENPMLQEFAEVFGKFSTPQELADRSAAVDEDEEEKGEEAGEQSMEEQLKQQLVAQSAEGEERALTRRERREKNRLSVAVLKQLVKRPEVVEVHDCNSHDPRLLVWLKSYRNTVPVPGHWSQKRKYLQNKRGIEKSPFELPKCIMETGIATIRDQQTATESGKNMKQSARQKMQPKMGKIDIDYQVLHDAFFRYQEKPKNMALHGELYYEGKEFEVSMRKKIPGEYSEELRRALGMEDESSPPPWLFSMQRYGPPPSYPALKLPGVNCQIPPGAQWGYNDGEWGKPPVDQYGHPLYGDVFGAARANTEGDEVDRELWATVEEEEEEEESDEDEDEDEDSSEGEGEDDMEGLQTPSGMESVSTMASGLETPETLQLRKNDGASSETPDIRKPQLYQVLEQQSASVGQGTFFGTSHTYNIPGATNAPAASGSSEVEKRLAQARADKRGEVEVALNPDELGSLDAASLKRKYEQELQAAKSKVQHEDFSGMVAEQAKKKRKKDQAKQKYKF